MWQTLDPDFIASNVAGHPNESTLVSRNDRQFIGQAQHRELAVGTQARATADQRTWR